LQEKSHVDDTRSEGRRGLTLRTTTQKEGESGKGTEREKWAPGPSSSQEARRRSEKKLVKMKRERHMGISIPEGPTVVEPKKKKRRCLQGAGGTSFSKKRKKGHVRAIQGKKGGPSRWKAIPPQGEYSYGANHHYRRKGNGEILKRNSTKRGEGSKNRRQT